MKNGMFVDTKGTPICSKAVLNFIKTFFSKWQKQFQLETRQAQSLCKIIFFSGLFFLEKTALQSFENPPEISISMLLLAACESLKHDWKK